MGDVSMISDHQRIGIALDELSVGVVDFFGQELRDAYGEGWETTARSSIRSQATLPQSEFRWDAQAILTVMWDLWNPVFRKKLGIIERSIVSELREFRNRWAHQAACSEDDCYRVLDNVQRLLVACGARDSAAQIEEHKLEVLRQKLGRRVNKELARSRFNRSRLIDSCLYAVCAVAIAAVMIQVWGHRHPSVSGFVVGFTMFVFCYLVFKRFQSNPPAYGVHECSKCSKVIYTENCPYCDSATHAVTQHSDTISPALIPSGKRGVLRLIYFARTGLRPLKNKATSGSCRSDVGFASNAEVD